MKLNCVEHNKRVMVLLSGKTIHRSTGEECKESMLEIGGRYFDPVEILESVHQYPPTVHPNNLCGLRSY